MVKDKAQNSPVAVNCSNLEGRSAVLTSAPCGCSISGIAFLRPVRPVSRNSFGTSLFPSCIIAIILRTENVQIATFYR